jgi:hypothetical protein
MPNPSTDNLTCPVTLATGAKAVELRVALAAALDVANLEAMPSREPGMLFAVVDP